MTKRVRRKEFTRAEEKEEERGGKEDNKGGCEKCNCGDSCKVAKVKEERRKE